MRVDHRPLEKHPRKKVHLGGEGKEREEWVGGGGKAMWGEREMQRKQASQALSRSEIFFFFLSFWVQSISIKILKALYCLLSLFVFSLEPLLNLLFLTLEVCHNGHYNSESSSEILPFIKISIWECKQWEYTYKAGVFPGRGSNFNVNKSMANRKEYTTVDQKCVLMHGILNSLAKESLIEATWSTTWKSPTTEYKRSNDFH